MSIIEKALDKLDRHPARGAAARSLPPAAPDADPEAGQREPEAEVAVFQNGESLSRCRYVLRLRAVPRVRRSPAS